VEPVVPWWMWFIFFLPLWSSIVVAYLYYKKAHI